VLNHPLYRLGLGDVAPDRLGRTSADRLRAFAENQGQSAGECSTPRQMAVVMVRLLDPQPGLSVVDPYGGSGGRLITCHMRLIETQGALQSGRRTLPAPLAPLTVFGQEINPSTSAMGRMNAVLHDLEAESARDDTTHGPACTSVAAALARGPRKEGAGTWTSRHPVKCSDADQERDALLHAVNAADVEKGRHDDARSAANYRWYDSWQHHATREAFEPSAVSLSTECRRQCWTTSRPTGA
jgi:hypothetical protein